jgi:tRNA(Arg) A34 adenosine deaminase TadA
VKAWRELEPAWQAAFELAWEAFAAGTIPVGAIVTDADGTVLARGRNRITESSAPEGQIFGSRVAHADINALVQLGIGRRYFDCTLWTTLEPCAQCIGAAWLSTIGRVAFAATDVYGGASKLIERQIEAADSARNYPMEVEGPLGGSLDVFSELLHATFFAARIPPHAVAAVYRARRPRLLALAERLRLRQQAVHPLDEVLPRIWDELAELAPPPLQRRDRPRD